MFLDNKTAKTLRHKNAKIAYLESNHGMKKGRQSIKEGGKNHKLNRKCAKNEGFGDDFGDFVMGPDNLVA
jgi:hypothetical protein